MTKPEQALLDRLLEDERLTDHRWVAYIMATVKHETNSTFEPVEEAYWLSDAWRRQNLRYYPAHGRGFVQITWPTNYEKLSYRLGIPDLATNYDLALDWDVAYEILVVGMLEGFFTGKDLDDYINEDYCDYLRARRIVNGMDRASLIAGYARDYERQISESATEGSSPDCTDTVFWRGMRGACVEHIQRALNTWGEETPRRNHPLVVDGIFGLMTEVRVREFQRKHDLQIDGAVGPRTWKALGRYL